jgi:signal transduction histidine kinase
VKTRAWWLYLLVMAPIVGLYLVGPEAFNAGPVFNAIGLTAVVAIIVGVRLHRPRTRAAWYLIAFGMALFVSGDVLAYNYEHFFGKQLPFPSIADVFYLGVFPAIMAGLLLLIRQRTRGGDRASLIDALIVGIGVGLLSWVFLMAPYAHAHLSVQPKLTSLAYPLADLLLLSIAVRLAFSGAHKNRSCYLTVIAVGVLFATDATYGWQQLHGGYTPGGLLDGGWIAFYLLLGAAALHPSMAVADGEASPSPTRLTRPRLVLLAFATFVAPITGLLAHTQGADRIVTAGSSIVLFTLVLFRMVDMVQRHEATAARERDLEKTTARLLELDQLKDQFVATVSHELRTPLTSIHGYLQLVLDDGEDLADEHRVFLAIAGRNTDRLRNLVADLLLVSELDAGELEFEFDTVDFRDLARESVESARPQALAAGISLELAAGSAMRLNGDSVRLGQLFDNVISNAVKFTPRGGNVSVRTTRSNGSAVLEVQDTGVGIAAAEQTQLFDRFFRGRVAGEQAIQGTGLGLSISLAIAQAHGGVIEVESKENVGTTFRVVLPS